MHMFVENGLKGGVCGVSCRYAKANNPEVKDYNSNKPTTWLQLYDINNLYGHALSDYLLVSDFEWVSNCNKLKKKTNNS